MRLWIAAFLAVAAFGQIPEYDFYPPYRNEFLPKVRGANPSMTPKQALERYAAQLRGEGVAENEIARRTRLISTEFPKLEADFWDRVFTEGKANYNKAPNEFLTQVVEGRVPGTALDYGMGEGRNALYLAKFGWKVAGFDPAAAAVALAQKRAGELGVKLETAAVADKEYDFGKERFDLVLFSWMRPHVPVERVIDSLKPGGIVVMECAADWTGRNGMLKLFDALEITHYQILRAKSDFYGRREIDVLRLVARKP